MKAINPVFSVGSVITFVLLLVLSISLGVWVFCSRAGVWYLQTKQYEKARQYLSQKTGEDSFSYVHRMNLALSYFLLEQHENSIKEYQTAPRLLPKNKMMGQGFYVHFNSAVSAAGLKDIPRALAFYQKALAVRPRSKEVKTNIELLTRLQKNQKQGQNQNQQKKNQQNQNKQNQNQQSSPPPPQQKPGRPKNSQQKDTAGRKWNPQQVEAILKSIQEQEKKIKANRDKGRIKTLPPGRSGKDW